MDLRLEERFTIETELQGDHSFDVYIEYKNTVYSISGIITVNHEAISYEDNYPDHDIDLDIFIDEVYSGIDTEYQHSDESLLEALKSALYTKIQSL